MRKRLLLWIEHQLRPTLGAVGPVVVGYRAEYIVPVRLVTEGHSRAYLCGLPSVDVSVPGQQPLGKKYRVTVEEIVEQS